MSERESCIFATEKIVVEIEAICLITDRCNG